MPEIDGFATQLLDEARRFLEKAGENAGQAREAYLHAAICIGFSAFEAHINSIAEETAEWSDVSLLDKSVLLEQELRLRDGEYSLGGLKMFRLHERVEFVLRRFSQEHINKSEKYWSALMKSIELRNDLTHPKSLHTIEIEDVERALQSIIDTLNVVYQGVYKLPYPAYRRGLQSKMSF